MNTGSRSVETGSLLHRPVEASSTGSRRDGPPPLHNVLTSQVSATNERLVKENQLLRADLLEAHRTLDVLDNAILYAKGEIEERDRTIKELDRTIEERDRTISELRKRLMENAPTFTKVFE